MTAKKKNTSGRRQGTYQQATRLLHVLDELRLHHMGLSVDELAERFGMVPRSTRRDLAALREAGYELETVESESGPPRVRLADPALKRTIELTPSQRFALLAVRRVFDVLKDTPLHDDVQRVYAKIAATLPADQRVKLDAYGDRFIYLPDSGVKHYAAKQTVLDALFTAVLHRKRVRYSYRSPRGTVRKGLLEPYSMVLYKHGLYVVGRPEDEPKPRVFAIERFLSAAQLRHERFEPPADFRVDDFFDGAFGIFVGGERTHVVVEFDNQVRDVVLARSWHSSQRVTQSRRGVRVELDVAHPGQLLSWVLGWGTHVRVKEPRWLADEVVRVATAMARRRA